MSQSSQSSHTEISIFKNHISARYCFTSFLGPPIYRGIKPTMEAQDITALLEYNDTTYLPFIFHSTSLPNPAAESQTAPPVPRRRFKQTKRKRSSLACVTCRSRKVRCNLVAHGSPCSNCRQDRIECVPSLTRKQKYFSNPKATSFDNR